MNNPYRIGNRVLVSFGSNMGLKGKVVGFIVELDQPVSDYFPTTHLEIRTTHVQTVSTVQQETAIGRIDGLVPIPVAPAPAPAPTPTDARHIYFNEYVVGRDYQMLNHKIDAYEDLGTLVKKELLGRDYDPDIVLTYRKNGVEKVHNALFGAHYREKP